MQALSRCLTICGGTVWVISIAAVRWFEFHREERCRRRPRNVQSQLEDIDLSPFRGRPV